MTTKLPCILREALKKHNRKSKISFKHNRCDYDSDCFTVTARNKTKGDVESIEANLVNNGVKKRLNPSIEVFFFMDGRHQNGALSQLLAENELERERVSRFICAWSFENTKNR